MRARGIDTVSLKMMLAEKTWRFQIILKWRIEFGEKGEVNLEMPT